MSGVDDLHVDDVAESGRKSTIAAKSPVSSIRVPLKENRNNNIRATTPTMSSRTEQEETPVSPTANLKLLTDMASLEKSRACNVNIAAATRTKGGRKDKSLALLCTKFLKKYREYPEPSSIVTISLDEAAKELDVERRRIYDIVNVFESVEMMCRVAKNSYTWFGKSNQKNVLARLEFLARTKRFDAQFESARRSAFAADCRSPIEFDSCENSTDDSCSISSSAAASPAVANDQRSAAVHSRKEKSLSLMSQKFVMLFLAVKPRIVSLDVAARILVGETTAEELKSTSYKTKIRRLYDIANILTSLQLIRKVHVTQLCMRKPAFEYIGPQVDCISSPLLSFPEETGRFARSLSDVPTGCERAKKTAALTRHPSLQEVCEVAAEERRKFGCTDEAAASNKRPTTAILMTHDGNPIHVITVATPSMDKVTLQVISKSSSSPTVAQQPTPSDGGQLLFEPLVLRQLPNQAALQTSEASYQHVLIDTSGSTNAVASSSCTDLGNVAPNVQVKKSSLMRSVFRPNILASSLGVHRRPPFNDLASSTNSTPPRNSELRPTDSVRSVQTPVIRYHRLSPATLKRSETDEEGQPQYSIVSKKLRM